MKNPKSENRPVLRSRVPEVTVLMKPSPVKQRKPVSYGTAEGGNPNPIRSPKTEYRTRIAVGRPFGLRISGFGLRIWAAMALYLYGVGAASARINVVTLPDRDSVQLTIYNSVDLTLVRETRHLTFRKGINKLEFSWANTLIDPTSVEFKAVTHADDIEVVDVSFPPRVSNTLEWRINSEIAGDVTVEIRYFTSGISWAADYMAEAARDEKQMMLAGAVRVTNKSGEDYENAQVRLIVGVIRLVEEIAELARRDEDSTKKKTTEMLSEQRGLGRRAYDKLARFAGGFGGAAPVDKDGIMREKEIAKEGISEYFLYTVEGRDTIPNGWSKRLPSFHTDAIPIISYYKFEKEHYGDAVMRYYRFTNSAPSHLGKEPLPDGQVKAFRLVSDDRLYLFVGGAAVKYIPIDEFVELELGADQEVMVKPSLMEWTKEDVSFDTAGNVAGWTIKETWKFEIQNSKEIPVVLDIRRNFSGDWALATEAAYENVDATKVKFVRPLKPKEKQTFSYQVVRREGTNARR